MRRGTACVDTRGREAAIVRPSTAAALVTLRRPHRYRTLSSALAEALRSGRYPPGSRLPSVRQLCDEHAASLATVTHALHELEDAGLIEARPRQGFFAREKAAPATPAAAVSPIELAGRRQRVIALAASRGDCLSLGHLALPPALLPLAPLRRLLARRLQADASLLASGLVFGSQALRAQLARRSAALGCRFDPEDIVVTHGEGESLQLCLQLLTRPGDVVAVTSPAPLRALELIDSLGLRVLALPSSAEGGLCAAALDQAMQHGAITACIVETGGSAVSGRVPGETMQSALADCLARHALPLIELDMMGELHHGIRRPCPLKAVDTDDRVLYCGSFACITGPGFSLGYVASGRHRLQLRAARAVHGELVPALTDAVLADFLAGEGYERHLRRLRRRLKSQVDDWRHAVLQHFPHGTQVGIGDCGYALWVELPDGLDALELLRQAREHGYSFVPGAVFSTGTQFDHCLRLTAAHPMDNARAAGIRLLGQIASRRCKPTSDHADCP
jgi:DNA-binding transcriptional MocR family regulator